jgi:hypothetical protein
MGWRGYVGACIVAGLLGGPANAANLLVNPDFDSDLSGWQVDVSGTGSASHDANVGSPDPGSAYLSATAPGTTVTVSQCVAIATPGIDLIARTYTDSSNGTSSNAVQIEAFDSTDCTGMPVDTKQTVNNADVGGWRERSLSGYPLDGQVQSVRVSFLIDSGDTTEDVHFDHIVFVAESIFADGFEP